MDVTERPAWAGKPMADLSATEITDALTYLDQHELADEILIRALATRLARRTAAIC